MNFPWEVPFSPVVGKCPHCKRGSLYYAGTMYRTDCCRFEEASVYFESSSHYWAHTHNRPYTPKPLVIRRQKKEPILTGKTMVFSNYSLPAGADPFAQLSLFDTSDHITFRS